MSRSLLAASLVVAVDGLCAVPPALARQPVAAGDVLGLGRALLALDATPLSVTQLTDAIESPTLPPGAEPPAALRTVADFMRRTRRSLLLADLLRADRTQYLETVSFLPIPRQELPNLQDVPIRACDPQRSRPAAASSAETELDDAMAPALVADCAWPDVPMGENALEGAILEVTRDIYSAETGVARVTESGIRGLLEEMRRFMLSPSGVTPAAQQEVLLRTLRVLMTPVLPPFYRVFMGGIVPRHDPSDQRIGRDPEWLAEARRRGHFLGRAQPLLRALGRADGLEAVIHSGGRASRQAVQWIRSKLPAGRGFLEPGRQLGPAPYAPLLTAVVAPFAFGFLVGPSRLNLRADGGLGGLVVQKCKFLQVLADEFA